MYDPSKPNHRCARDGAGSAPRFLYALSPLVVLRVVVLDNGSLHRNALVRAALPQLWTKAIYLYYLPPYSPELNGIELLFWNVKHHGLAERSYSTISALESVVDHAFGQVEDRITAKRRPQPRLAA